MLISGLSQRSMALSGAFSILPSVTRSSETAQRCAGPLDYQEEVNGWWTLGLGPKIHFQDPPVSAGGKQGWLKGLERGGERERELTADFFFTSLFISHMYVCVCVNTFVCIFNIVFNWIYALNIYNRICIQLNTVKYMYLYICMHITIMHLCVCS